VKTPRHETVQPSPLPPLSARSFETIELTRFVARAADDEGSIFRRLLEQFERVTPYSISFDDSSGIFESVARLRIPFYFKRHHSPFCEFAKKDRVGFQDCIQNKHAIVGIMFHRPRSLCGQCHLGLTEIVEPLVFRGRFLGAFYAGAVLLEGTEAKAHAKIEKYAARREVSAKPYKQQLDAVPKVTAAGLDELRVEVQTIKEIVLALLDDYAPPMDDFKVQRDGFFTQQKKLPPLLRRTVGYIEQRYRSSLTVSDIARALGCHAYYLGKVFRQHMGMGVLDYINEVRVQHACVLLQAPFSRTETVATEVGYQNAAHFCRVFKARRKVSPSAYRKNQLAAVTL
jgi:AraC-like DNA-binding protein/ligand-binding sensor protein